jgi:hypothetical protein
MANPTSNTNAVRMDMSALNQKTTTGRTGEECHRRRLSNNTRSEIASETRGPYQNIQSSSA